MTKTSNFQKIELNLFDQTIKHNKEFDLSNSQQSRRVDKQLIIHDSNY